MFDHAFINNIINVVIVAIKNIKYSKQSKIQYIQFSIIFIKKIYIIIFLTNIYL